MKHSEFIYRIWDSADQSWQSRFDWRSGADAQNQIDWLAANGADVSTLVVLEQEIVWNAYSEVSVPIEEIVR